MDAVLSCKVASLIDWLKEDVVIVGLHGLLLEGTNHCTALSETLHLALVLCWDSFFLFFLSHLGDQFGQMASLNSYNTVLNKWILSQ